ncbi:hypothetical protein B0H14DRAFT_2761440, partial [Mycena olivaceomarginata]
LPRWLLVDFPVLESNTNYTLSDPEILEIRALLVDPTDELARMDAQIEAMNAQIGAMVIALNQLEEQRELLKGPIDAHRALISSIRRAPEDVIREIFFHCLPSEHDALIDSSADPLSYPLSWSLLTGLKLETSSEWSGGSRHRRST